MTRAPRFKDRLSGALLTLAMLAGALSLFLYSFETLRQSPPERETILTFPRPRQEEPVTIIDARGAPRRAPLPAPSTALPPPLLQAAPSEPITAPILAPPPGALEALGHALFNCTPERLANLPPSQRADCPPLLPPPPREAKHDGSDIPTPPYKSKNQALWDEEMARKNTPMHLPGGGDSVFSTILGTAATLLTDPGAFLDKRSYTTPLTPTVPKEQLNKADAMDRQIRSTPACPMMLPDQRTTCEAHVAASGEVGTSPSPPPRGHPHASDTDVQAALAAASRRHGIKPATTTKSGDAP